MNNKLLVHWILCAAWGIFTAMIHHGPFDKINLVGLGFLMAAYLNGDRK